LNKLAYLDYILDQTQKILSIDSPTGFTRNVTEYVWKNIEVLGIPRNKL
jgi:putative aminopeptidase FrvX